MDRLEAVRAVAAAEVAAKRSKSAVTEAAIVRLTDLFAFDLEVVAVVDMLAAWTVYDCLAS